MKKTTIRKIISAFLAVSLLSVLQPERNVFAIEGGSVTLTGSDSIQVGSEINAEIIVDAPAEIGFISLTVSFEAEQFQYNGFTSNIGDVKVDENEGLIYLDVSNVNIAKGQTKIGSLTFISTLEGNARFSVLAASLFTPSEEMIAADTSRIYYVTVNAAQQETQATVTSESANNNEIEITSSETSVEVTVNAEPASTDVTDQTTAEEITLETPDSSMDMESQESTFETKATLETQVSLSESVNTDITISAGNEVSEESVTTSATNPTGINKENQGQSRLIWVPVVLLLLAGVTGVSLLIAKRNR